VAFFPKWRGITGRGKGRVVKGKHRRNRQRRAKWGPSLGPFNDVENLSSHKRRERGSARTEEKGRSSDKKETKVEVDDLSEGQL